MDNGWAASNIVFGQGGALHHSGVSRDMQCCAFKSSYQVANGKSKNIYKDPIDSSKKSKQGKFSLIRDDEGKYITLQKVSNIQENDLLKEVFRNGKLLIDYTLEEVKANLNS